MAKSTNFLSKKRNGFRGVFVIPISYQFHTILSYQKVIFVIPISYHTSYQKSFLSYHFHTMLHTEFSLGQARQGWGTGKERGRGKGREEGVTVDEEREEEGRREG